MFGTDPGFVSYATSFAHAKTASLLFPADDPTGQVAAKLLKTLVRVPPTRNQLAFPIPNVRQCPKAIVLQFEKKIWMVKRLSDQG